jgi:hypothetical protein
MKKYTSYFKTMIMMSLIMVVCFILTTPSFFNIPDMGAITGIFAFLFWFAAVEAKDHEKYQEHNRR